MFKRVWAIADLHLSFGIPEKHMKAFGPEWENYTDKIETVWRQQISENDLILIAGDISWAMHIEQAQPDLAWIGQLPGTKLLLKGNHDYWWGSLSKIKSILPPSCQLIQNNSVTWKNVSVAGSRLWDTFEFSFNAYIDYKDNPRVKNLTWTDNSEEQERIFQRELGRLESSLKTMNPRSEIKIAMTHYPPISGDLKDSRVSTLLEKYRVNICVFGHLHNVKPDASLFGTHHGIHYYLTACDYLNFKPLLIYDSLEEGS
jgi:predicted phosphohydrolase